jgi:hypothetical protein
LNFSGFTVPVAAAVFVLGAKNQRRLMSAVKKVRSGSSFLLGDSPGFLGRFSGERTRSTAVEGQRAEWVDQDLKW